MNSSSAESGELDDEAKKLAKGLGWENFIETSALTQHNLKEVFDEAIMASLKGRKSKKKQAAKKAAWHQGCNCAILWRKKKRTQNSTKSHSVLFSDTADQNATKSHSVLTETRCYNRLIIYRKSLLFTILLKNLTDLST